MPAVIGQAVHFPSELGLRVPILHAYRINSSKHLKSFVVGNVLKRIPTSWYGSNTFGAEQVGFIVGLSCGVFGQGQTTLGTQQEKAFPVLRNPVVLGIQNAPGLGDDIPAIFEFRNQQA